MEITIDVPNPDISQNITSEPNIEPAIAVEPIALPINPPQETAEQFVNINRRHDEICQMIRNLAQQMSELTGIIQSIQTMVGALSIQPPSQPPPPEPEPIPEPAIEVVDVEENPPQTKPAERKTQKRRWLL